MPRPARKDILGSGDCVIHLYIRCHNGDYLFAEEVVKLFICQLLLKFKTIYGILVYDYTIMDNHIHLVLYVSFTQHLSKFMQRVNGALARFINKKYGRTGRVFGDRAKTPVIGDRNYHLATQVYIATNPVRAGMVKKAKDYAWSGYRHYAYGEENLLIDDAPEYLGLSKVPAIRRKMYREFFIAKAKSYKNRRPEFTTWYFIGDKDWILKMMTERGLLRPKKPPD